MTVNLHVMHKIVWFVLQRNAFGAVSVLTELVALPAMIATSALLAYYVSISANHTVTIKS